MDNHSGLFEKPIDKLKKIVIGQNVCIGANALVMPSVTIGENCIISAGSIVTYDVQPNIVAYGTPDRLYMSFDEYVTKLKQGDGLYPTWGMSYREKKEYCEKYVK